MIALERKCGSHDAAVLQDWSFNIDGHMDESRTNILGKGIGFSHALFHRKLNVAPKGAAAQMRPNPWQLRRTGAQFHLSALSGYG